MELLGVIHITKDEVITTVTNEVAHELLAVMQPELGFGDEDVIALTMGNDGTVYVESLYDTGLLYEALTIIVAESEE